MKSTEGKEVNKIIAEFMGIEPMFGRMCYCTMREQCECCNKDYDNDRFNIYSKSLDALVPVWEKVIKSGYNSPYLLIKYCGGNWEAGIEYEYPDCFEYVENESPYLAAAHATAKAITELNDGK